MTGITRLVRSITKDSKRRLVSIAEGMEKYMGLKLIPRILSSTMTCGSRPRRFHADYIRGNYWEWAPVSRQLACSHRQRLLVDTVLRFGLSWMSYATGMKKWWRLGKGWKRRLYASERRLRICMRRRCSTRGELMITWQQYCMRSNLLCLVSPCLHRSSLHRSPYSARPST